MRQPLKEFSHQLRLLLSELRHSAGRAVAQDELLQNNEPQVSLLEQRLMMSASPAAVVGATEAVAQSEQSQVNVDEILDQVFADSASTEQKDAISESAQESDSATDSSQRELIIIDSAIDEPQSWISQLRQKSNSEFEVLILEETQNGVSQIGEFLKSAEPYSAIHLVSHGTDGHISLGDTGINLQNLDQHQQDLASWKDALSEDGDVLIYGCDLAASDDGKRLVQSLSTLWDADVAASEDKTGHQNLSADWEFEYQIGLIQSEVAFSTDHIESWQGVLSGNAAPVNVIPDGQVILENRILSFNGSNGAAISVSDSDAAGEDLLVTISASNGTFTLTDIGDAELVSGQGLEDSTIVLSGSETELNLALQTLHYVVDDGYLGVDEIVVTTNDQGNGGIQTAETDTDVISIYVHNELFSDNYTLSNVQATDERNQNVHRGVSRSLAAAPNGNMIAVWRTTANDVFYSIEDREGLTLVSNQINDTGTTALDVAIASGTNGDFIVAWSQTGGSEEGIFAQQYSASGILTGGRIAVNNASGTQQAVTIDRNAAGDFVIAWESSSGGVHARRYASDGTAIDSAALSPTGSSGGTNASIGIDRDRNLLVGWEDSNGQYIQRLSGSTWGTKHTLSTADLAGGSAIGMTENGKAVIAWHYKQTDWQTAYQLVAADGSLVGSASNVSSSSAGDEWSPSVAMDESGKFVIAWEASEDIQARQFGADGVSSGGNFNIATTADRETNASVALLDINNFAVLYSREDLNPVQNDDLYIRKIHLATPVASNPVIYLPSQTFGEANTTMTQRFMVGDDHTDSAALNFGVTSSNSALISASNVSITGTGLYRDLVITPTADMVGSSNLTVTVTDDNGFASSSTIETFVQSPTIVVTTNQDEMDGTVTSILDLIANPGGSGISLREAIAAANNTTNNGRLDRIEFNVGGTGQETISLLSELPTITDSVFIDGQTQTGYSLTPLIGLDGSSVEGNGLTIEADDVVVRGLAIFGFQQSGIDLDSGNGILLRGASDSEIYNNYVGVDQSGSSDDGNERDGIRIVGESHDNVIGGAETNRGNVISANNASGIDVSGSIANPSSRNEISFNYIGLSSDGTTKLGNRFHGIDLQSVYRTDVLNNVISGNEDSGIEIQGGEATETKIQGNKIGVAADGTTAMGNEGDGIALFSLAGSGPSQTIVGGLAAGEANIIANNGYIGVRLDSGGGVGNSIRGNQIYNNALGLGIDMLGVSDNDTNDADGGTNGQQNYPEIQSVSRSGGDLIIQGTLNSTSNTVFDIDVYSSDAADASGHGEAETFIGTFSVSTNGSGNATFNQVIASAATLDRQVITATATDSSGNTSEFAQNYILESPTPTNNAPEVSLANTTTDVDENTDTSTGLKIADILITDDGTGINNLSLGGADAGFFEITGSQLRLKANVTLNYEEQSSYQVDVQVDDPNVGSGIDDSESFILSVNDLQDSIAQDSFWFSTTNDIASLSNISGIDSWDNDDVIAFGNPSLSLGTATSGHSELSFSLDEFVQDGSANVIGLHYVSHDITVGTTTSIELKAGDILFTTSSSESYNGGTLTSAQHDVMLFRPDSIGDHSSGTFSTLLDGLGGSSSLQFLTAFTLVEQDTLIGDTVVSSGDFLFVETGNLGGNDIFVYEIDAVGTGTTSGTKTHLINGGDLGISGSTTLITGLELVERTTSLGGLTFNSGTLLLVASDSPSGLTTKRHDIFSVDVTETEIGSNTTTGSSSLVFNGIDIGMTGADQLSALSLGPDQFQGTAISASGDSYVEKFDTNQNYGSSTDLVVDKSGASFGNSRAFVQFDLSAIRTDVAIESVELRMNATDISDAFDVSVYQVTEFWTENGVTWNERGPGNSWATTAGSVNPTAIDTFSASSVGIHTWDVASIVRSWSDGSVANYGFMIASPQTQGEDVIYDSREGAVAPQLIIQYTDVTNTPPIAAIDGPITINEGDTLNLDASGSTDPNGDTLTYAWDLDNDGSFDDATGTSPVVVWSNLPSSIQDNGTYTVRVSVSDGTNPAQIASTTLTINNLNPTGVDDPNVSVTEDSTLTLDNLLNNDTDPAGTSDPLSIDSVDTTGTVGTVTRVSDTSVKYETNGQFESLRTGQTATDTFTYSISDDDSGTASGITVTVTIHGANDAPTNIFLDNLTVLEDSAAAVVGQLSTTDLDSIDSHTYSVDDSRFEVIGSELRLKVGTSVDYETEETILIEVTSTDIEGAQVARTFTIDVVDQSAPVAEADHFSVNEGGTVQGESGGTWFDSNWSHRREIQIDNSTIATSLTNYALRLRFHPSAADAIHIDYSSFNADGSDLVFVDPDGTVLAYEIEQWTPNGFSDVWVQVPVISGGTVDSIMMYYGSTAANPSPDASTTWQDTDRAILHLNRYTTNSSGQTTPGFLVQVLSGQGVSGAAAVFSGSWSQVRLAADTDLDDIFSSAGSVTAWINPSGWGGENHGRIADKASTTFAGTGSGSGWALQLGQVSGEGQLIFEAGFDNQSGRWKTSPGSISLDQWQHVAVVYDSSSIANDPLIFIDGVEVAVTESVTPVGTAQSDSGNQLVVGNYSKSSTRAFDGTIDEFRLRDRAVSAAEIAAEYRDINSPAVTAGAEQTESGILHNDVDPDGDTLSVTLVSGPAHAAAFSLQADGSFTYTHDGSETATDSFVYQVSDGTYTNTATVNLDIVLQNDNKPVVTAGQSFNIAENTTLASAWVVEATDEDQGTTFSTWTITGGNDDGYFSIDSTTGEVSVTPAATFDFESVTSFTLQVSVSDGTRTSDSESVVINVTDVNDNTPTVTSGQTFDVSESAAAKTAIGVITATDVDTVGALTNWAITSGNEDANFLINSSTGEITLADPHGLDFETKTSFTLGVSVSDGTNSSITESVVVNVTDANDIPPVVTAGQTFTISELATSGTNVGTLVATDPEASSTTSGWAIVSGNENGLFNIDSNSGELTLAKDVFENFTTNPIALSVTVTDGVNGSASEVVLVHVTLFDRPPVISSIDNLKIKEDSGKTTVDFNVSDSDTPNSNLTVTAVSSNNQLIPSTDLVITGTGNQRQLALTPNADQWGVTTIRITASDGTTTVTEDFKVIVKSVNDKPIVSSIAAQSMQEDGTLVVSFSAQDVDTDLENLKFTATSSDSTLVATRGMEFSGERVAPRLKISPQADQFGTTVITLNVSDGKSTTSTTFTLDVNSVNDAPTFSSPKLSITVAERSIILTEQQLLDAAFDVDGDELQLLLDSSPTHGELIRISPSEFKYTPEIGYEGKDTIEYSVTDGSLQSESRVLKLNVTRAVVGPVAPPTTGTGSGGSGGGEGSVTEPEPTTEVTEPESPERETESSKETSISQPSSKKEGGSQSKNSEEQITVLAAQESAMESGFVFRKFIAIDEAGGRDVGDLQFRSGSSTGIRAANRQDQQTEFFDGDTQFSQTDWQFYSDLSSTVGGVDEFRSNLKDEYSFSDLTTGTITLASTGAAVGFVVTAVRSGMLALGFLSQLPIWTLFDPLMVVEGVTGEEGEEDSLQDIVDKQSEALQQEEENQNQS